MRQFYFSDCEITSDKIKQWLFLAHFKYFNGQPWLDKS